MIYRNLYRAQIMSGMEKAALDSIGGMSPLLEREAAEGRLMTISLFHWERHLVLYVEGIDRPVWPDGLFEPVSAYLEKWPGGEAPRCWVPAMDIFHNNEPQGVRHWSRKTPVRRTVMKLGRLNPGHVSSYIFYHYQLQEEKPGSGHKYGLIGLHENWMFFYKEEPFVVEPALHAGRLQTRNTPSDWAALMEPHFLEWPSVDASQKHWRDAELILRVDRPDAE